MIKNDPSKPPKWAKFWPKILIFGVVYQPFELKIHPNVGLIKIFLAKFVSIWPKKYTKNNGHIKDLNKMSILLTPISEQQFVRTYIKFLFMKYLFKLCDTKWNPYCKFFNKIFFEKLRNLNERSNYIEVTRCLIDVIWFTIHIIENYIKYKYFSLKNQR